MKKHFELIMAFGVDYLVGVGDGLPWHIPEELKLFKQKTDGNVIIMGKGTFLGMKKFPLPNRVNVVLSSAYKGIEERQEDGETVVFAESLEVFTEYQKWLDKKWFVIGGPATWTAALKTGRVSTVHASAVDRRGTGRPGEVFYTDIMEMSQSAVFLDFLSVDDYQDFSHVVYNVNYEDGYEEAIDLVTSHSNQNRAHISKQ